MTLKKKLSHQVILIRGVLFFLQILTSYIIPPYDTSAREAYQTSDLPLDSIPFLGHGNWDAVYFNYLARNGYDYENFGAFFPLYPTILAVLSTVLHLPLQLLMSYDSCIVLTSILLNNTLFYINSLLLFKLATLVGLTEQQSYRAALLYSLNPANIFMSVGYSESLFSLFVILGLILRESDSQWYFLSFCLAAGVRSNGAALVFFILYDHITCMMNANQVLIVNLICMLVQSCTCVAPFVCFQNHIFDLYCTKKANVTSEWCDYEMGFSYGYIQSKYWGVGLFKYWQLQQLPNFLLAAPMFILVAGVLFSWARHHLNLTGTRSLTQSNLQLFNFQFAGYLHLAALTGLALISMHVQVVTRFIVASCPYLFVYCAKLEKPWSQIVVCYFVVYSVVGTVVHSTFYPWT